MLCTPAADVPGPYTAWDLTGNRKMSGFHVGHCRNSVHDEALSPNKRVSGVTV